jgi:hypothetical protein
MIVHWKRILIIMNKLTIIITFDIIIYFWAYIYFIQMLPWQTKRINKKSASFKLDNVYWWTMGKLFGSVMALELLIIWMILIEFFVWNKLKLIASKLQKRRIDLKISLVMERTPNPTQSLYLCSIYAIQLSLTHNMW